MSSSQCEPSSYPFEHGLYTCPDLLLRNCSLFLNECDCAMVVAASDKHVDPLCSRHAQNIVDISGLNAKEVSDYASHPARIWQYVGVHCPAETAAGQCAAVRIAKVQTRAPRYLCPVRSAPRTSRDGARMDANLQQQLIYQHSKSQ